MRQLGLKVLVAACAVIAVFLGTAAPGRAANLTGTGGAAPSTVPAGVATLLTVAVTPSDSPPSTNILVSVNVSSIGGPPSILLHDDGTNGDVTAGDNLFSALVIVSRGTTPGVKSLAVTISDSQSHTATTSIGLIVTATPQIVVSQVYGGGGNAGATLKNDFIELFNRDGTAVDLSGWSVQYAATTGTSWQRTNLSGTLQPGQYFLIQEAAGTGGTTSLPTPDATGSIAMSATGAKVALVGATTLLSGSCPIDSTIDFVGYDGANCSEGSATGTLSNTTAALRKGNGCIDTDSNANDFLTGSPSPRNTASALNLCGAPSVSSTIPAAGASGVPVNANISITFSESVTVTDGGYEVACANSGGHNASASGGPSTFTLDPATDFAPGESCTVTVHAANVSDQDGNPMAGDYVFSFTTESPPTPIHDIQGASHTSPLSGQNVTTLGIVTAKSSNGFWMQDPNPDADPATSEGIFVFTSSAPSVNAGDAVNVQGRVQEFRPGGAPTANLTTTELAGSPSVTVLSSGNPLPAATVVGTGGRIPPNQVIEDDATGNVETNGVFDPASDGLDFWESLEGMRLQLNNAVAVGPTNAFGETQVIGDDGANASLRTYRGGLLLRPNDANPERVVADDLLTSLPAMNVGDHYDAPLVGVLDYNFGNYFLEVTDSVGAVHDGVTPETTDAAPPGQIAVATFNFENLDPTDPQSKFDRLAGILVNNLKSPDIVSGEEVQDDNGPTDNGVVGADSTLDQLVSAIQAAGGPHYEYRYINPVDDQDGGEPGGNIRQVFLFRTDRGLQFVDRPGGGSTTPDAVVGSGPTTQLLYSPGRIDPGNSAWNASRKPLAGEFTFNGHRLFVIANHFNSKGGDDPLEGRFQPPTRISEVQRHEQAQLVHDFVASLEAADPAANVVVDGDLNDFEFSDTVHILENGVLTDLMDTLPENQRYSYVFEGNSQTLDHILLGGGLLSRQFVFDPVHVNAEFADQASDHDPSVARISLNDAPTADAGGPYSVAEGSAVTLTASGGDPEGGPVRYAWDLDGDGTFETPGQSVSYTAADGPASATVKVRVTDGLGASTDAQATVNITNVAPTVTSLTATPSSTLTGQGVTLTGTATDPSAPDTTAGFTWAFDTGSGFGQFGSNGFLASFASCGTYTVAAKAQDKDVGTSVPFTPAGAVRVYDGGFNPPVDPESVNLVQAGQVVPVKIAVGCNGFLGGLHPAITMRAGDYDPNVDPDDPTYFVQDSASNADTDGVMRESSGQYVYNLRVPTAQAGTIYTLLIRPFGGSQAALHALLKIRR
ncbi:MAG TPA: Ig-like domain-containing protein [Gaiellaceae bacterium]